MKKLVEATVQERSDESYIRIMIISSTLSSREELAPVESFKKRQTQREIHGCMFLLDVISTE